MQNRVQQLLEDICHINEDRYLLVQACRQLILSLHPDIREEVKYGGLLYGMDSHFCGIFSYQHHVTIEFSEGAALEDNAHKLEGKGKLRSHIKLMSIDDIEQKLVSNYLQLAIHHLTQDN